MNNLRNYFSSSRENLAMPLADYPRQTNIGTSDEHLLVSPRLATCRQSKLSRPAKANNRQIVSNMESVMNSVKKKHRRRKKKESPALDNCEPEITDISNILSNNLNLISPHTTLQNVQINSPPLRENYVNVMVRKRKWGRRRKNEKSKDIAHVMYLNDSLKTTLSSTQTSRVSTSDVELKPEVKSNGDSERPKSESASEANAFILIMNGRNRVLGSTQSGNELAKDEVNSSTSEKTNRKALLQEWAEKRKLAEIQQDEYAEYQMEKPAKRLKIMFPTENRSPKPAEKLSKTITKANNSVETLHTFSSQESIIEDSVVTTKIRYSRSKSREKRSLVLTSDSSISTERIRKEQSRTVILGQSENSIADDEDSNFVQKLSSPIQKRDNLLCYFSKVASPKNYEEIKEISLLETHCKAGNSKTTRKRRKRISKLNDLQKKDLTAVTSTCTGRPRRSCAGQICYDEDIYDLSMEKSEASSVRLTRYKLAGKAKNYPKNNASSEIVICLDSANRDDDKKSAKLALVFKKNVATPSIDPAVIQARNEFLMSGIPEKMKLEIAKQSQFEKTFEISWESMFPKLSHIRNVDEKDLQSIRNIDWFGFGIYWDKTMGSPIRSDKLGAAGSLKPFTPVKKSLPAPEAITNIENKIEIVKSLKTSFGKFPTYRCYKQLRIKHTQIKKLTVQQITESFVILNSNKTNGNSSDFNLNGELLFTEKYKPTTSAQVLVNYHPVNELKSFLVNWQNSRGLKQNENITDFEGSTDSFSGSSNSIILHGPSSSGKSNAVFAVANELNFNVLEINAGMKRNGKKLLQELHEATQSHLVNNDQLSLIRTLSELKGKEVGATEGSSILNLSGSSKHSLILVEDADIVFEQDSGFTDAIHQLVATSKRPVVIISDSAECPHLMRLQKQSQIAFHMPNVLNISKFLSILSLVESCPIELDEIVRLYLYNKRNLRKTLLEMQFFIQSGGDRIRTKKAKIPRFQSLWKYLKKDSFSGEESTANSSEASRRTVLVDIYVHQTLFDFFTLNQNANHMFQYPLNFGCLSYNLSEIFSSFKMFKEKALKKRQPPKLTIRSQTNESLGLDEIVAFYSNVSVASYLTSREIENRLSDNLEETIAHTLVEQAVYVNLNSGLKMDLAPRDKHERPILSSYLSQPFYRNSRSIDLDYEPALRSICRSEKARSLLERQGSRFYHYLRNICIGTNHFFLIDFERTSVLSCSVGKDSVPMRDDNFVD